MQTAEIVEFTTAEKKVLTQQSEQTKRKGTQTKQYNQLVVTLAAKRHVLCSNT